jgi:16S rRNA (uracil1498-N3)-methyltransferase
MRIPRFYLPATYQTGKTLELNKQQVHHAVTVLRLKNNRQVEVFDGKGKQARAKLIVDGRRSASIVIEDVSSPQTESPLNTILCQAISKGDRMDYTIQKCVELGITNIQPLITENCDIHLDDKKLQKKQQQWQQIAIAACEQANRNTIPIILPYQDYQNWLKEQSQLQGFVLNPDATIGLNEVNHSLKNKPLHLLIGAEGGLTTKEVEQAITIGLTEIKLGNRILRTETAGVAVLSALQLLWGDF